MIILDTNVVSETFRPAPEPKVLAWLDAQVESQLVTTSITVAEMMSGMELMPDGRRKEQLRRAIAEALVHFSHSKILPFDESAAVCFATLAGAMKLQGLGVAVMDTQIAAIALNHGATVATRDVQPFLNARLRVINPWEDNAAQK